MEENWLRGRLSISDIYKSMGAQGITPKVLRKLLLQGHSWLPLKFYGDWEMFLETRRKQRSFISSRRVSWKCGELQDTEPHLGHWEAVGKNLPETYFQIHEGQEVYWEQSAYIYQGKAHLSILMAFTMRSLARKIKCGEQLMFFNSAPVKSLNLWHYRQANKVRVRKVDMELKMNMD